MFLTELMLLVDIFKNHILYLQFYAFDDKKNCPYSMVPYISSYFISTSHIFPVMSTIVKHSVIAKWLNPTLLNLDAEWGRGLHSGRWTYFWKSSLLLDSCKLHKYISLNPNKHILNSTSLNWVLKMPTVRSQQYIQGGGQHCWSYSWRSSGPNWLQWKYLNITKYASTLTVWG